MSAGSVSSSLTGHAETDSIKSASGAAPMVIPTNYASSSSDSTHPRPDTDDPLATPSSSNEHPKHPDKSNGQDVSQLKDLLNLPDGQANVQPNGQSSINSTNPDAVADLSPEESIADKLERLHFGAVTAPFPLAARFDSSGSTDGDLAESGQLLTAAPKPTQQARKAQPEPWPRNPYRGPEDMPGTAAKWAPAESSASEGSMSEQPSHPMQKPTAQDTPQLRTPDPGNSAELATLMGAPWTRLQQSAAARQSDPSGMGPEAPQLCDEDDDGLNERSRSWRKKQRHLFVITTAGKPVFTRYGDEAALASFTALVQALSAFAKNRGDTIRTIRSGQHLVAMAEKGPLLFVATTSGREPAAALLRRLDLLHGLITLIVTDAIDRLFAKNPRYDGHNLLTGTSSVLGALADEMEISPWGLLPAFPPAPLQGHLSFAAALALQSAVEVGGAEYGVLLSDAGVIALASARGVPALFPSDLLLLATFVRSNESLRQNESMCPLCLPRHNPSVFLHTYVAFLRPAAGFAVALLATAPDSFPTLSAARELLETSLNADGVTQAMLSAARSPAGGRLHLSATSGASLHIDNSGNGSQVRAVPAGPLRYFVYHVPSRRQYLAPSCASWPGCPDTYAQDLMSSVSRAHVAMFGDAAVSAPSAVAPPTPVGAAGAASPAAAAAASARGPAAADSVLAPLQRLHFVADARETVVAYASQEAVLYAVLQPGIGKGAALEACQSLTTLLRARQHHLFLPASQ